MFKVNGLPTQITKSDLEELFSPYGEIQITETSIIVQIKEKESIAFLQLNNPENEQRAIKALDRTRWRDKILHLEDNRGTGISFGQPTSGGNHNNNQPTSGDTQNNSQLRTGR
jgi:RNA recognition motif-containing protein